VKTRDGFELDFANVGSHTARDGVFVASGSAEVVAYGSAVVVAYGSAEVTYK